MNVLHVLNFTLVTLSFVLRGASVTAPRSEHAVMSGEPQWIHAVVFEDVKQRPTLKGVKRLPKQISTRLASFLSGAAKRVKPGGLRSHQIWLAGVGTTKGIGYFESSMQFELLPTSSKPQTRFSDDGTLRDLVRGATMPQETQWAPSARASTAQYPPPPIRLDQLVGLASMVLVGRVSGILRVGHDPQNSTNRIQHTVFVVAVEDYLKTEDASKPLIVKVWQSGGRLAWSDPVTRTEGVAFEIREDPLLNVGDRYVLFLRRTPDVTGAFREQGFVSGTVAGRTGKISELDEYICAHHWYGKLRLDGGFTRPPRILGSSLYDHWRFVSDPQILDVPEALAVNAIRQTVLTESRGQ